MAAEFYHKTAALFEEFKKRELRYLHTDKGMQSSLNWKNDFNVSSQDYLQKINKRERETEQTYRELMKHMEDLDKQTDQMSLKLEKLHALRNIAISSNNTAWPSVDDTFDRPLQSYQNRTLIHNTPIMHSIPTSYALHSISSDFTLPKFNSCDESTQTDEASCAKCNFPFTMYPNRLSDASLAITNTNISAVLLHKMNETFQNPTERGVQFMPSTPIDNINESYSAVNHSINEKRVYENFQQDLNAKEKIPSQTEFSQKESTSVEVPTLKFASDTEVHRETEVHWSISNDQKIDTVDHKIDTIKEPVDENTIGSTGSVEHAVSKSDDESVNHEFDFLESDKRSSIKSDDAQLIVPSSINQSDHGTENLNLKGSHNAIFQENSMKIKSVPADGSDFKKQTKQVSEMPYKFDAENMERIKISEDLKLDSSVSGGHPTPPFESENASLASESDSFSEKETNLTATAAYQALLGNVSAAKTARKRQPISDSEDEIENALATAVRKSSNVTFEPPGPSIKTEGRRESVAEAKLKSEKEKKTETKSSISSKKPQTKLSKGTRKVLGLDTSSGSEVELAVKTNVNKTAEDSDEFDFYD